MPPSAQRPPDATVASGLTLLRLEYLAAYKLRMGPFGGQGNRSVLRSAATEMKNTLSSDNCLFQALCDDLIVGVPELASRPHAGSQAALDAAWV